MAGRTIRKVALISPPISLEERYGELAGAGSTMPSLGLLSLAAVAMRAGVEAHVIEAAADNLSYAQVMDELSRIRPDLAGITATTLSIYNAEKMAGEIKKFDPGIVTVIGGPHVSAVPEETMRRFPSFDIAVLGEGEETFVRLIEALSSGAGLSGVQGLALRTEGGVARTGRRPGIKELDSLPLPAWELLRGFPQDYRPTPFRHRQLPAASIVTSRGCPNNCIFCDRTVFGRACRLFSAEYVLDMVRHLREKYGIRELVFEDDTFVMHKSRVMKICEGLARSGWGMTWSCLGRVDMVDPEMLRAMKEAGCWQIGYGIESGNQAILDLVEKRIKLERVSQALKWTRQAGILTKGFFILGFPTETRDTMRQTMEFAKREALDDISVFKLTPLPGSRIYEMAERYGAFDNDWRKMNLLDTVFVPKDITKEELEDAAGRMLREFYLRPKTILSYAARVAGNPSLLLAVMRGFAAFVRSISKRQPTRS